MRARAQNRSMFETRAIESVARRLRHVSLSSLVADTRSRNVFLATTPATTARSKSVLSEASIGTARRLLNQRH